MDTQQWTHSNNIMDAYFCLTSEEIYLTHISITPNNMIIIILYYNLFYNNRPRTLPKNVDIPNVIMT